MSIKDILQRTEQAAGLWPARTPGHVDFGAEAIDVEGHLPDGVHRLEGSAWQVIVEGGKIIQAIREDLLAWRRPEETVHPLESEPGEQEKSAPSRAELNAALAGLPGNYTDAEYVVAALRRHFGDVFTDEDEAEVRKLVKPAK